MEAQLFSKLQMFDLILIERAVFVVVTIICCLGLSSVPKVAEVQQSPELSLENFWNNWVRLA